MAEKELSNQYTQNLRAETAVKDNFWDLDAMLPKKMTPPAVSAVRDTETVDITFENDTDDTVPGEFAPMRETIPPASHNRTAAARQTAQRRAADASFHTPGDVQPTMSVPVCTYSPENSLLKTVSVFRWPTRYNYYERFTADANRYFQRTGTECPFVNFFAYMPQYSLLTPDQLSWYFYWRDNVRKKNYLTADYSYLFLYIYEIINLPEKIKPEDGLSLLCDVWLAYRGQFPRLDRYMGEWVCDYCLIYELPAPTERLSEILPMLVDKLSFKEFYINYDRQSDCPFTASLCDILSNYNWRKSKYVTPETRPLFETHLYAAMLGAIAKAWKQDDDFSALLGLSEVQQTRNAFSGTLCAYNSRRRIDISYISLSRSYQLRFIITDLYKLCENNIRAHLGIKSRLTATGVPDVLRDAVRAYFAEHLPPYTKPPMPREQPSSAAKPDGKPQPSKKTDTPSYDALYEPPTSALSTEEALRLEQTSWANTALLVTEEAEDTEETNPKVFDSPVETAAEPPAAADAAPLTEEIPESDDPYVNFINHLNPTYYQALKHIICGEEAEYRALCQSVMMLPDAMAGAINEIAVTYTDDIALDADGAFYHLSDYYANEIMNAVVQKEDA